MPKRIIRKDIKPLLLEAAKLNARGKNEGTYFMEAFKEKVQKRIRNGEHIHLYADNIEECINPDGKCWEGPRDTNATIAL